MTNFQNREFTGTTRFIVQRRLGAGGFGVVYQVYDRELNTIVALKTLHEADAEALYRFKHEFRSLADITHPNLVTLYELIAEDEQWFFTMELVRGINFLEYVQSSAPSYIHNSNDILTRGSQAVTRKNKNEPSPYAYPDETTLKVKDKMEGAIPSVRMASVSIDFERLRESLQQLAKGVSALHQVGKLHCDLKPSNVLVTNKGKLLILDFGLVTELSYSRSQKLQEIIGTPAYMSPEQGAGQPLTEASDWYSVGVMLYETLTGKLPFDNRSGNIFREKLLTEPPPPAELVEGIPEDLNLLCQELLRRNPIHRPVGTQVLARLGIKNAEIHNPVLLSSAIGHDLPLVGREHHLATLKHAFEAVQQGQAMTVYLHGQSGMGKSTLIRHFLTDLLRQHEDLVVLEGRCYEQESVPYKAFDSVIDAFSQYIKRSPKAIKVMPEDILALARLFPVLLQVDSVTSAERKVLEIPDSQELRRRAFTALRELLTQLAAHQPLILFIDDLQWGDLDSAALLSEILCPPDPPVLLLIVSYRSEAAATSPFLRTMLPFWQSSGISACELAVNELSLVDAEKLAINLMGEDEQIKERANSIAQESGGIPFFIGELVRYTQMNNPQMKRTNTGSLVMEQAVRAAMLDEIIQTRVGILPSAAQRLLEVVAVSGQPIPRTVAKQAAGLEDDEQMALAVLRTNLLVRIQGEKTREELETYHDRIRETIITNLSSPKLKSHYQQLSDAMEAAGIPDPERLAFYLQKAGNIHRAAVYVLAAAERAASTLAFDRAAYYYQLTLEILQTAPENDPINSVRLNVPKLHIKLAESLANAGRSREAGNAYLAAAGWADKKDNIAFQQRAAEQMLRSGYIDEAIAVFDMVLDRVGLKMPSSQFRALVSFLLGRARFRLRGIKFTERPTNEIDSKELTLIDTCWSMALGLAMVDTIRGADFQTRHLLLALKAGEPYRIARALALEVAYSSLSGGASQARTAQLIAEATALSTRVNHPHAIALSQITAGSAAFMEGRWRNARTLIESAETALRETCTGVLWEINNAQVFTLRTLFYLGEINELSRRLPAMVKEVRERDDLYGTTNLLTRVSYISQLAADEPVQAEQEVRTAIERWSRREFYAQHYFAFVAQADIALYAGDGATAWQIILQQWPNFYSSLLRRVQYIYIEACHLRARCALAAAVSAANKEPLLRSAEQDAQKIEKEHMAYGNAWAQLIRAAIAAMRAKQPEAITLLESIEAGFQSADMTLYTMAARRRRGQLIGGITGDSLIVAADEWMKTQHIVNPERMVDMLAPGNW